MPEGGAAFDVETAWQRLIFAASAGFAVLQVIDVGTCDSGRLVAVWSVTRTFEIEIRDNEFYVCASKS